MDVVIPSPNKEKYVLCRRCKALYRSPIIYHTVHSKPGIVWYFGYHHLSEVTVRSCQPCPDCGFELNTCPDETLPWFIYWMIAAWRIFWHGRIDYKKEKNNCE